MRWALAGAAGLAAGLAAAALQGCSHRQAASVGNGARYVVGSAYQAGGVWFYPREDFQYDRTGLATILESRPGRTADGEPYSASALTAAHQTLQLPAAARVTNLQNGLQVLVRVNDRGPASPARLIALSPRAARMLGIAPDGVARVRVQVDESRSLALRAQLHGSPPLAIAAAPRGAVWAEDLPPPPGVTQSQLGRSITRVSVAAVPHSPAEQAAPEPLPETVQKGAPQPGHLMIAAGSFGEIVYARQAEARLAGLRPRVDRSWDGRNERYTVHAGPYQTVLDADAALAQALRAGLTDARIVVE